MKTKYLYVLASALVLLASCGEDASSSLISSDASDVSSASILSDSSEQEPTSTPSYAPSSSALQSSVLPPTPSSESSELEAISSSDPSSELSSSEVQPPYHESTEPNLADFQTALRSSHATSIQTSTVYNIAEEDLSLHSHSTLLIEYGSPIKMQYSYSYEMLNEIVTGNEPFLKTVIGNVYAQGSYVGDGVEWMNSMESSYTLTTVDLSKTYVANGETVSVLADAELLPHRVTASVVSGKEADFFGRDYGVSNVSFVLDYETAEGALRAAKLTLKFECGLKADYTPSFGGASAWERTASVESVSYYSYDPQTVVIR